MVDYFQSGEEGPREDGNANVTFVQMADEELAEVALTQEEATLAQSDVEQLIVCEGCASTKPKHDFMDDIGHQYNMCLQCRTNLGWRPPDPENFPYEELQHAEHVVYDHVSGNYVAMTSAALAAHEGVDDLQPGNAAMEWEQHVGARHVAPSIDASEDTGERRCSRCKRYRPSHLFGALKTCSDCRARQRQSRFKPDLKGRRSSGSIASGSHGEGVPAAGYHVYGQSVGPNGEVLVQLVANQSANGELASHTSTTYLAHHNSTQWRGIQSTPGGLLHRSASEQQPPQKGQKVGTGRKRGRPPGRRNSNARKYPVMRQQIQGGGHRARLAPMQTPAAVDRWPKILSDLTRPLCFTPRVPGGRVASGAAVRSEHEHRQCNLLAHNIYQQLHHVGQSEVRHVLGMVAQVQHALREEAVPSAVAEDAADGKPRVGNVGGQTSGSNQSGHAGGVTLSGIQNVGAVVSRVGNGSIVGAGVHFPDENCNGSNANTALGGSVPKCSNHSLAAALENGSASRRGAASGMEGSNPAEKLSSGSATHVSGIDTGPKHVEGGGAGEQVVVKDTGLTWMQRADSRGQRVLPHLDTLLSQQLRFAPPAEGLGVSNVALQCVRVLLSTVNTFGRKLSRPSRDLMAELLDSCRDHVTSDERADGQDVAAVQDLKNERPEQYPMQEVVQGA